MIDSESERVPHKLKCTVFSVDSCLISWTSVQKKIYLFTVQSVRIFKFFYYVFPLQRISSDLERHGGGHRVIEESGTITLSTGLGDNINLNLMAGLSDDEEEHKVSFLSLFLKPDGCYETRWKF